MTKPTRDWSQIWHNAQLDVRLLQAFHVQHAYARHSHDYYVICVIEQGRQSFTHKGCKQYTPPGGVILMTSSIPLVSLAALILAAISFVATSLWALFGNTLKAYLHMPYVRIGVNLVLALSLVYVALVSLGVVA